MGAVGGDAAAQPLLTFTKLLTPLSTLAGRGWAWALWEATLPVPKGHKGPLELVCKATDESYNTQVGGREVWLLCFGHVCCRHTTRRWR